MSEPEIDTETTLPKRSLAIIVDDDTSLATTFALSLEMVGFLTEIIQDSRQAMKRIEEAKPDLVTLDMQMPYVSGPDLLRQIRGHEMLSKTKVMLVTANGRIGEEADLNLMADVILIKPVTFSQIKEFATRLIQRRQPDVSATTLHTDTSVNTPAPAMGTDIPTIITPAPAMGTDIPTINNTAADGNSTPPAASGH
jgi:DNA-binding response OmpR family regulator